MRQRRRVAPFFRNSNQPVNSIHITPTELIDPCGNPCRASSNIGPGYRGAPTKFAQLTLAQSNFIHGQRALPTCPPYGCGGKEFRVRRKVLPGRRCREVLPLGQFHAHVHRGPFQGLQLPKSLSEKGRALSDKAGSPRPEISPICVAIAPTAPPDLRKI